MSSAELIGNWIRGVAIITADFISDYVVVVCHLILKASLNNLLLQEALVCRLRSLFTRICSLIINTSWQYTPRTFQNVI